MQGFGAFVARQQNYGENVLTGKIELALENIFNLEEILKYPPKEPLIGSFWLPDTQIAGARENKGSHKGFYFAAKGGHNNESHNHNDVGSFILYYNGHPAIVDVGVGTYTSKTFSPKRYEIWTMQSQYHNLPLINDTGQKDGQQYAARKVNFYERGKTVRFETDIARAYPEKAGIQRWLRTYELNRGRNFVITDDYLLKVQSGKTRQHLITACTVENDSPGNLYLRGKDFTLTMEYDPAQYQISVEDVAIDDQRLMGAWPEGLTRIVMEFKNPGLSGKSRMILKGSAKAKN